MGRLTAPRCTTIDLPRGTVGQVLTWRYIRLHSPPGVGAIVSACSGVTAKHRETRLRGSIGSSQRGEAKHGLSGSNHQITVAPARALLSEQRLQYRSTQRFFSALQIFIFNCQMPILKCSRISTLSRDERPRRWMPGPLKNTATAWLQEQRLKGATR